MLLIDVLNRFCKGLQVITHYPSKSNESPNLHVEVLEIPSHRYELQYQSVRIEREDHRLFWSAVESMKSGRPFTWKVPVIKGVTDIQGVGGDALALATPSGSLDINVRNAPANVLWLATGDMINFANQTKVYKVCNDVVTNNAGVGTIRLNCPLKHALPEDTVVIGSGATFTLIRKPGAKAQSFSLMGGRRDVEYAELEFIEFL
ncbi:TPA: hypothetical protein I7120_22010 [Vibrio vulnificus]|nr:hypothetical protein [Vibrio vulnificus]